jgi:hypothetical protein
MVHSFGGLFSEYFLTEGVAAASDWDFPEPRLASARETIRRLLEDFEGRHAPKEAETERDLIEPLLSLLGWEDYLPQITAATKGRSDVPDFLLFAGPESKQAATGMAAAERYCRGATILEAKSWETPLDRSASATGEGAPSTQILRYLNGVEVLSNGAIRFGILTNGSLWRLYDIKARSKLEGFVEINLKEAAGLIVPAEPATGGNPERPDHLLRLFLWVFGRDAFVPTAGGRSRLEQAVADSRSFEARVTEALAQVVFEEVFPALATALAQADPDQPKPITHAYLAELREASLTWLYRLLFVLYAEDRELLPTRRWRGGLRRMREQVAEALDGGEPLSSFAEFDGDLRRLWRQIDQGDEGLHLPPYNGGLFNVARSPLLERAAIPDRAFAPLLDALSRERIGSAPRFINFRDLNVQHLGSVYERLLEFDLVEDAGVIAPRPQTFARKTSGSYYTPEDLVMLVIRRTVGPLLEERRQRFREASERLSARPLRSADQLNELARLDPATAFLELKICDPAMGSGHFLVSLVDYLADEAMRATVDAPNWAAWADYRSPLIERLETIRHRIEAEAQRHGWTVLPEQLVDRQLVRRMILKRVIYGVDKNPMAVELAKLSLWLHTFTVGAPLSFLDHHLRCGDSLFGEWVRPALDRFAQVGLFKNQAVRRAEQAIGEMQHIEELTDADMTEVRDSADSFEAIKADTAELRALLSVLQGFRWIGQSTEQAFKDARKLRREADALALRDPEASARKSEQAARLNRRGMALEALLEGEFGEPGAALDLCYGRLGDPDPAKAQIAEALAVAQQTNFLHWQVAFPGVWSDWEGGSPIGGFDAVIGNPPWDRLKMQEVEWFAARKPEIAYATRAADRKRLVQQMRDKDDSLASDYDLASRSAAMAARMAGLSPQLGGQYPLLGGGDVNLYTLFVERASRIVKPDGLVGLLVPSGISGDLSSSRFFRSISTTGRLGCLFDYENRKIFFPDVHASFKFSAIVFGGLDRRFPAAQCGFYLTTTDDEQLAARTFALSPDNFAAVNPNSGTAPIFRSRRDSDLVTAIYARVPVLADHRVPEPERPWKARYLRMFDMTNDSDLFWTAGELESDGWYPVSGGRWRKGRKQAVPLYEGKMVQAFDHRAASVVVNEDNLKRPAQQEGTVLEEHQDPAWLPQPQFYVELEQVEKQLTSEWNIAFKAVTAPTNMRTMIAGLLPLAGVGNSMGMILVDAPVRPLLYANLNSFVLDYVCRQKVQGQNLNWYIVEQLPVLPPSAYEKAFGKTLARDIVTREVLRLTYTSHDMAPLARDLGHVDKSGEVKPPFEWDEYARRQQRARLDALFFHLYGIARDEADYVLSTFPIVRRHDEAEFDRYLTRDLILHQMDALSAGDTDAAIQLR